jgi:hypothetical protein
VPPRALAWTRVPHSSLPRNEGVPGSSPGVGFLPICREEVSSLTSLAGGQLEQIPANARSKPFEGNILFCRAFSYPLVCRDFCGLLKFSSQVAPSCVHDRRARTSAGVSSGAVCAAGRRRSRRRPGRKSAQRRRRRIHRFEGLLRKVHLRTEAGFRPRLCSSGCGEVR